MAINFMEKVKSVKSAAEIERPPEIPLGTYKAIVTKIPDIGEIKSDKGEWETLTFQLQVTEPSEDVDQDELAAYGPLGKHSVLRRQFMFDKNDQTNFDRSMFNLRQFLESHLRCWPEGISMAEAINNSLNQQCYVFVRAGRPDKNTGNVYHEIGKTSPIE